MSDLGLEFEVKRKKKEKEKEREKVKVKEKGKGKGKKDEVWLVLKGRGWWIRNKDDRLIPDGSASTDSRFQIPDPRSRPKIQGRGGEGERVLHNLHY